MFFIIRAVVWAVVSIVLSLVDAGVLLVLASQVTQIPLLDTFTYGTWFVLNLMVIMPITTALGVSKIMEEL